MTVPAGTLAIAPLAAKWSPNAPSGITMWTADSANTLTGLAMLRKKTVNNRFTATASTSGNWGLYEGCLKTDHPK